MVFTGNWTVSDGFIVYETKFCNDPKVDISQSLIHDKVIEATNDMVLYEALNGTRLRLARAAPRWGRATDDSSGIDAIKAGDMVALQRYLESGEPIDQSVTENGMSLLMIAIQARNNNAMRLLVEKGANVDVRTSGFGKTALFFAAYNGNLDAIALLLKKGADFNATDDNGNSALREAILGDQPEALSALLEAGCVIDHKNKSGVSMFDLGHKHGSERIKAVLNKGGSILRRPAPNSPTESETE